jgi:hypothetical protein
MAVSIPNKIPSCIDPPVHSIQSPVCKHDMAGVEDCCAHLDLVPAGKEAWERLFSLMRTQEDANTVLELLRADAKVREATGFDWYVAVLSALVWCISTESTRCPPGSSWAVEHHSVLQLPCTRTPQFFSRL